MQSRLVAAVAVAAVIGAGAAGCSHSDKASTLPTPAPSSVTSSAAPAPTFPATPEGAADFARHFYALIDAAFNKGDTRELRLLSAPSCASCSRLAGAAERIYSAGGRVVGPGYSIKSAVAPALSGDTARVDVDYSVGENQQLDAGGRTVNTTAAVPNGHDELSLIRQDGQWRVAEIVTART